MRLPVAAILAAMSIAGCGNAPRTEAVVAPATIDIKLIAFNDLHGNLDPPKLAIRARAPNGGTVAVPAGGVAYMASAVAALKRANPNHAVVSAGDMISASPLVSALFLDEPTIEAVNSMKIDFNAVGNHEFDRGQAELLRMQNGGCAQNTLLVPCRVNPAFPGANFGFLAANTLRRDNGQSLFPATGMKTFTQGGATVKLGFIGMTLRNTPTRVTPAGVAGLRFEDEAATANALVPKLKAQGADAIVLIVHEGGIPTAGYNDHTCQGLGGDILPILERLDPAIDVVVSGHTHSAYICDYGTVNPARPFLLTSAGRYGTLLTDIDLRIDTRTRKVVRKVADNVIVQGEGFTSGATRVALTDAYPRFEKDPAVEAIVERYRAMSIPLVQRVAGKLQGAITRMPSPSRESAIGNLVADAQLAATRARDKGGAQIAFMNPGGVRADLIPSADGSVSYGQLFSVQPFGNGLVVKRMTGAQIGAALEQQFASGTNTVVAPRVLFPSQGFSYAYDLSARAGARVTDMRLDGLPIDARAEYRVTVNSFLATGGDNFTVFDQAPDVVGGDLDVDALEAYLQANSPVAPPSTSRIRTPVRAFAHDTTRR